MHAPSSRTIKSAGHDVVGTNEAAGSIGWAGRRLLTWISRGGHRHRAVQLLSEASDDTLEDIGFSRAEVTTIARYGLDPARRLR